MDKPFEFSCKEKARWKELGRRGEIKGNVCVRVCLVRWGKNIACLFAYGNDPVEGKMIIQNISIRF